MKNKKITKWRRVPDTRDFSGYMTWRGSKKIFRENLHKFSFTKALLDTTGLKCKFVFTKRLSRLVLQRENIIWFLQNQFDLKNVWFGSI